MKFLIPSIVLISIIYGINARCFGNHQSGDCPSRVFPEPEPKQIHYIYQGESCDCPKYHDVVVQKPKVEEKNVKSQFYEFGVVMPEKKPEEEVNRYIFDLRVEQPVVEQSKRTSGSYGYHLQSAPEVSSHQSPRYIFDTRVEQPIKPCEEKPWQGLVAQVDTIVMPSRGGCKNPSHSAENCNCGCKNPSHTSSTCDCDKDMYKLPIIYSVNDNEIHKRIKRNSDVKKSSKSLKHRDVKLPKLKKIDPKELSSIFQNDNLRQKFPLSKNLRLSSKQSPRSKRREGSSCGYTFESCDLKRKTPAGCPLCYKCKCEPSGATDDQKFSPRNLRIPYRVVSQDEQMTAPSQQEFDYEAPAYTGLKQRDMYKQYIQQIISKYPEHMARKLPDLQDQQRDLMSFIGELARNDQSPNGNLENEDARYKVLDNAVELYKFYENSVKKPKSMVGGGGRIAKKRGTVVEVIEVDPRDYKTESDDSSNSSQT